MDSNFYINMIAAAPIQNSSRYFEAGMYLVEVDNCKIFLNRQRRPRAAVDVTVIDSNNVKFPQTSQLSWVVSLDSDSGASTIKGFIRDVLDCEPHEITGEVIGKAFINTDDPNAQGQRSILLGRKAVVNAYEKATKSGGVYTKLSWKRFDEEGEAPDFRSMPQVGASTEAATNDSWGGNSAPAGQNGGWGDQPSTQNQPTQNTPF